MITVSTVSTASSDRRLFPLAQLEMKQRHLVSKMNAPDEKEGAQEELAAEVPPQQ
jgi:hypothetical protein